jgi:hypothetical protein
MTDQDDDRTVVNPPLAGLGHEWRPAGHAWHTEPSEGGTVGAAVPGVAHVGGGPVGGGPVGGTLGGVLTLGTVAGSIGLSLVLGLCGGIGWALLTAGGPSHPPPTRGLAHLGVVQARPATAAASSPVVTPTPSATTVPPSGPFTATLIGYASQQCVDPMAGAANGVLELAGCFEGAEQLFTFQPAASGAYTVVDKQTGDCMDVFNASTADGAQVVHWPCNGGANQEWALRLAPGGDGQDYQLVSVLSGKCLDATALGTQPGTPMQQWDCHQDPFNPANQAWRVEVSP